MTPRSMSRAGAVALVLLTTVLVAVPARAAAYRYWTYWRAPAGASAWAFATQGPGTTVPADGDVEGWRFAVSTQAAAPSDAPRAEPDFDAVCGGTPAPAGSKRVALLIDSGVPGIGPTGQQPPASVSTCVVADADATGYEVLRSVVDVRTDAGLICGIAGYPAGECAPVLSDAEAAALAAPASPVPSAMATPQDTAGPTSSGPPALTVAVLAVVALVGLLVLRRRRHDA
jgi:MYXO-CTERM domain-containing protein